MKIFTIIILFTFVVFYKLDAIAETKQDCSIYSNKNFMGMLDKRRCEKGFPPREKISSKIGKSLKKLNPFKKKN